MPMIDAPVGDSISGEFLWTNEVGDGRGVEEFLLCELAGWAFFWFR